MCLNFYLLILVLLMCDIVGCYKILGIFPHPGRSHLDTFSPLMKELALRGHEVTVVSHFPLSVPIENYTDISLRGSSELYVEVRMLEKLPYSRWNKFTVVKELNRLSKISCETALSSLPMKKMINYNSTYDMIIFELFNCDCFLGFIEKFNVPYIGISSSPILHWINRRFGNPSNPAYIPNMFLQFSDKMNFLERVENTVVGLIHTITYDTISSSYDAGIIKKYFVKNMMSLEDLIYNASLLLVNTHFSYNLPRPLSPNVIEVGGMHVMNIQRLPNKLEKWVNESTEGVVYFSLGSVIKGHTFPEDKKQAFLRAFGRLPQRVLWKWENDTMPGKPDNVMIQKWMPQLDILCHPNVKAFISHGGLLGTTEAVHCGVPVIVMPQFGDQFTNAKALEANGGGVILHLYEATEEKVYNALKTVLDPNFRKKAKELSERFRDRPLPPLETAIYWVEYVARHKGARHMRTAAVDMPLYQYLLLDVIAFLAAVVLIVLFALYYVFKTIIRFIFARNQNKVKTN